MQHKPKLETTIGPSRIHSRFLTKLFNDVVEALIVYLVFIENTPDLIIAPTLFIPFSLAKQSFRIVAYARYFYLRINT